MADHLKVPSSAGVNSTLLSVAVPQKFQNTGSATGNPRNKCALKPGHSLMDWIRLGNSGVDLSGTGGRTVSVTREELVKHNTRNDAWIAINGVVYNVTRYMDFHPGGVEELMRGVGSDATKLFNEVHAWVNYSQLLNKCRIGPLTNTVKMESIINESPNKTPLDFFAKPVTEVDIVPRLDWIQKQDDITLFFYTKQLCNPGSLIRKINNEDNHIEMWIFIGFNLHKFNFTFQGRVKWPPKLMQISTESGKIEVKFKKHDEEIKLWSDLGKYKKSKILSSSSEYETSLLDFKMSYKHQFNTDSFVISLKNENIIYTLPIGYHVTIEDYVNEIKMTKCYTPVPKKYIDKYFNNEMDMGHKHFLIKQYPHRNSFSHYLCNLETHTTLKLSLPKASFKLSTLASHKRLCFLAAGSGLTPFLGLIDHLLQRNTNRIDVLKLLYFNKTSADIWCNEMLNDLSINDERFEIVNILSNAEESWSGKKGRVCTELLFPIVNKSMDNISYIAACGPNNFIINVEKILNELNFPSDNLFIF
ncbi:cytochrome b5 reductase 4 [Lucilia cuprina]|uniref:cytochrome b5 reductase 4 n=1 Tax=Lucilia cuprina TaxID=7375 RepID=UPI001F06524C|nr:cytochrome b5 reductase 4 [Lucilia cuprina]XP_046809959.1 cytochrome b5 reductase 4 [Lucilia cuprina]